MKALASCSGQFKLYKMIIDVNLKKKKIFIQLHSPKQTMKHLHNKVEFTVRYTRPITALDFLPSLFSLIFLSKYIGL